MPASSGISSVAYQHYEGTFYSGYRQMAIRPSGAVTYRTTFSGRNPVPSTLMAPAVMSHASPSGKQWKGSRESVRVKAMGF
jgi:hypothetical protein